MHQFESVAFLQKPSMIFHPSDLWIYIVSCECWIVNWWALASLKLIHVGQDNFKIDEIYKKNETWSLKPENGLPEFLAEAKLIFWIRMLISRGRKYQILSKKLPIMTRKILQTNIQVGKLGKKPLFFTWFFWNW